NRIFTEALNNIGLPITYEETMEQFTGLSLAMCLGLVERSLQRSVPEGFADDLETRTSAAFEQELKPIFGIVDVLETLTLPFCVASNSVYFELKTILELTVF